MSNSEIQKYFEINFNSHIIKKTFGLIFSFLRGIGWRILQSYSFEKITRNILQQFEFIVVIFLLFSWMAVLVCFVFSKEKLF